MKQTPVKIALLLALALLSCNLYAQDDASSQPVEAAPVTNTVPIEGVDAPEPEPDQPPAVTGQGIRNREALVVIGNNAELATNETAEAMVVIGGRGVVLGRINGAAVVIGGDLEIRGEVNEAAVAVMGSIHVKPGAKVDGDVVAVGGQVRAEEGASITGQTQEVGLGIPNLQPLQTWFTECVLLMRPLSFKVGWVWAVLGVFLLFYLFIALVFQRPIAACVDELNRRPATTFLLGLLTKLLLPLLFLLLAATGIGVFVIPFILAALFIGLIVGKIAIIEWLGFKVRGSFHFLVAFLVGFLILTAFYLVPFLGLLMFALTSLWGLGAAVAATFGGLRREMPEKPARSAQETAYPAYASAEPAYAGATAGAAAAYSVPPYTGPTPENAASGQPGMTMPVGAKPPVVPDALSFPRARFWERVAAGLIDLILILIVTNVIDHQLLGYLVVLTYFVGLWMWRGTTVGGIVLNLKVVRLDGQKISFPVALVRALTGLFGILTLFLGFLWIIWDPEKQAWQDKVAGTVVVRTPRGIPLVMF